MCSVYFVAKLKLARRRRQRGVDMKRRARSAKFVRRWHLATGLCMAWAVLLWVTNPSAAQSPGYWTCSDGKWIGVGQPQHVPPLKICGSRLEIPRTQLLCERAGGRWGPAGLFPKSICRLPTHDAGRICADTEECEGFCLAALTPAQRDFIGKRQKLQVLGKCTPYAPMFGCMAIVKEGFVTGLICRD